MTQDRIIGQRVGALMAKQGMTQGAMAAKMGITQAAISRKLSGERPWFAEEIAAAAEVLGVSVGDLFGERRKPRRVASGAATMFEPTRRRSAAAAAMVAAVSFSG